MIEIKNEVNSTQCLVENRSLLAKGFPHSTQDSVVGFPKLQHLSEHLAAEFSNFPLHSFTMTPITTTFSSSSCSTTAASLLRRHLAAPQNIPVGARHRRSTPPKEYYFQVLVIKLTFRIRRRYGVCSECLHHQLAETQDERWSTIIE
jgi:hypothetical protein